MRTKKNRFLVAGALCSVLCTLYAGGAHAAMEYDTEDPMFLPALGDVLSRTGLSYSDDVLKISERLSYGFSNKFSMGIGLHYQQDFDGPADGFSNIDLFGTYRLSGDTLWKSDVLFGIKVNGNDRVREPEFANTVYYAGLRVGRQWNAVTLAGTIKTSWIFDEVNGMAYIDLTPEAYFRITENWKAGLGADFRISTDPMYDQEWLNTKILRQYGRTQYIGHFDYEFESEEFQVGAKVNILF